NLNSRVALVTDDRSPGDAAGLESNRFPRCDAPDYAQRIEGQSALITQADHHEAFRGDGTFGRYEKKCLAEFADELAAIAQRGENAAQMPVPVLRRALIGVASRFVLEEADDLEIRLLHVGANHLDGHLDAQRLLVKNRLLGCS